MRSLLTIAFLFLAVELVTAQIIVRPGDSLAGIASRYGTTIPDLLALNPSLARNPSFLPPGINIGIPNIRFAAEDSEDRRVNWGEITKIAGQVNKIGQILGYDAEDLEDGDIDAMIDVVCKVINTVCKVTDTGVKVHDTVKKSRGADSLRLLSYDAEDADDKFKLNLHEITKIAGQVSQIGKVLGYDAEDIDASVTVATVCAIIGAACAVANTGMNIYDHVKGDDETEALEFDAEDLDDKKINLDEFSKVPRLTTNIIGILRFPDEDLENGLGKKLKKLGKRISKNIPRELPKVTEIAGKVSQIGEVLGYDAEDAEDKVHWSVTVGNEDELENKINWGEITKIAGHVNRIGQVLGYDAEDLTDKKLRFNPREITKIAGQVAQIGHILGFDAEDVDDKIHIGKIIKRALPLVLADDEEPENIFNPTTVTRGGRGLHWDAEDVVDKVAGGCTMPFRHLPRRIKKLSKKI